MISIIIPNFNGRVHLGKLLPTIRSQTVLDFEVILVDNASSDSSVETARSLYPEIRIVELQENIGFAAACNRGAEVARGEVFFFLNSDTSLDRRCLTFCSRALQAYPEKYFFQPKIIKMGQNDRLDGAGDLFPKDGRPVHRGMGMHSSTFFDGFILFPCGAAAIWRRDAFEKLGGFEESFFAYLEDVDLGLRAVLAGKMGWYIPEAVVYHLGGGAADGDYGSKVFDRPEAVEWIARNKIWLWARCLPLSVLVRIMPWLLIGFAKSAAYHTFKSGAGWAFWHGTAEGIMGLPKVLRARSRIQSERIIAPGEFLSWIKQTPQSS